MIEQDSWLNHPIEQSTAYANFFNLVLAAVKISIEKNIEKRSR